MPGVMGTTRIMDCQLSGRVIDAPRAYEWGLWNQVLPGGNLDATVEGTAQILLLYGPRALAAQTGSVYHGWMPPWPQRLGSRPYVATAGLSSNLTLMERKTASIEATLRRACRVLSPRVTIARPSWTLPIVRSAIKKRGLDYNLKTGGRRPSAVHQAGDRRA